MIPIRKAISLPLILILLGCGDGSGESTMPRDAEDERSRGPEVDMTVMLQDPRVASFEVESREYRRLATELRTLEAGLAEDSLSDSDMERWQTLQQQASEERRRLNRMIYQPGVEPDQRAAMWWLMQPESANSPED